MGISNWKSLIERRTANIGFLTRTGGFNPPTEAQIAAAKAIEINAWQRTKGEVPFKIGIEYSSPLGSGINLKRTREPGGRLDGPEYTKAIDSYITIPMDHFGILEAQGIDVAKYTRKATPWEKFWDWLCLKTDPDYEAPRVRLTDEFIKTFSVKEEK